MCVANPFSAKLVLAPLADVSDLAFRLINRRHGCAFAFTEMIHARSLCYDSKKTHAMLRTNEEDQPLGIQLLGNDPDYLCRAVDKLQARNVPLIDLNAGCPQPKVSRRGDGAGLLQQPSLLWACLRALVRHVPVPVTVKIRLGWDRADYAVDIARGCEDSGVRAVCVHGRTRMQGFGGTVDYASIRHIKQALRIPVYGSGDIFSADAAQRMIALTGCDGVFLARGVMGNPWLFAHIEARLADRPIPDEPDSETVARTMKEHFSLARGYLGERGAVIEFRKHYIWYTRGFEEVKKLRQGVCAAKTQEQMWRLIDEFSRKGKRVRAAVVHAPQVVPGLKPSAQ